jgi:hypothetical protein
MKRTVIFAFRGDPVCFVHVLLNAIDLHEHDQGGKIVMEGEATKLIPELNGPDHPLHGLYRKVRDYGLIDAVCLACATKMGATEAAKEQGLRLVADMSGHPGMRRYLEEGYQVITL